MEFSKELVQKAKSASSAEELLALAKENGISLSESDAATYFDFLHGDHELSDDELSAVAGGLKDHENKHCPSLPTPQCTGSGFLCGLDSCSQYVETADPNGMPTPYTYPVLCTCNKGHFTDVPMNRPYDA